MRETAAEKRHPQTFSGAGNAENVCGCFAACRAEVLLLHTCLTLLDELLGHAGAAAAGADGKGLGFDQQLVHGHLDMVLFCQLLQDGLEPGLLRPLEGHGQAEPGRKAHELLPGVGFVDVVAGAVGQGLLDEVAAVGGGVYRNVPGPAAHAALENGFQGGKVIVVGGEAQVIDEEDELEGVGRQLIHQVGDLVELVLLDLHQPQTVGGSTMGMVNTVSAMSWARFGMRRLKYAAAKPRMKMKYVYYYDKVKNEDLDKRYPDMNDEERARELAKGLEMDFKMFLSPEQIRQKIDLSLEGNHFVRLIERESGEKTFLRVFDDNKRLPSEAEISIALKGLVTTNMPKVGFLIGHGERDSKQDGDRNYNRIAQDKPFRYSLINQGFAFEDVTLEKKIPADISILVVAELRSPITDEQMKNLDEYVARGGNLLIAGEPNRQEYMNPLVERFGVSFMPGCLVERNENFLPNFIKARPTPEICELAYVFEGLLEKNRCVTMPGCTGLAYSEGKGFQVIPMLVSDTIGSWNELETTNFVDDSVSLNPVIGEVEKSYPTALVLLRTIGSKEQKIVILGDADCISNGEVSIYRKTVKASNFAVIAGVFYWLSDGEAPIDIRRPVPPDDTVYLSQRAMNGVRIAFMWGYPGMLLLIAVFIWLRRRGR